MQRKVGVDSQILKRIEESKRKYTKKEQRAELLKRNEQFKKALKTAFVKFKNIKEIKNNTRKIYFRFENLEISIDQAHDELTKNNETIRKYMKFMRKWHISSNWDGEIDSLSKFIKDTPIIIYDALSARESSVPSMKQEPLPDESEFDYLYLKIDAWTSLDDIKKIWPRIQDLQKKIFDFKAEQKSNFGRDLCWYDLKKQFKLSYGQIAKLWSNHCPGDIDSILIKSFKKENEKEIKTMLKGKTFVFDDNQKLLHMIKMRELGDNIKSDFEEKKEFYITGKTEYGKFTPRFLDAIKQGIKRIEGYIKLLNIRSKLDYIPFPEDYEPWELEILKIKETSIHEKLMQGEISLTEDNESQEP
ncbi:MAG: hypothetical protein ACFFDI_22195 [Promethearchaeota archaeon]